MEDATISVRISAEKKAAGNAILERSGLTPSQGIGLLYDRLVEEGSADFLTQRETSPTTWRSAAMLVDSIASTVAVKTRFDKMTRKQVKVERLKAEGKL